MNTLSPQERRARTREARDAFPPMGIYAIRDKATGRVMVAASRNVPGAINRIGFELRQGTHTNRALQADWNRDGAERFSFEVLELLKQRQEPDFDYAGELRMLEEIYRAELGSPGW